MSNRYGSNEEFVLAGGGNTSFKDNNTLYVKGSGAALSEIKPEQFVIMNLEQLLGIVEREYSQSKSHSKKEEEALFDMMAARLPGEENKRPSVECVLHAMFPYKYVLHVHPALINGLTCSLNGKNDCNSIFGNKVIWIDLIKPGFTLAQTCNRIFKIYENETGKYPQIVILQNHGIFVAADTVEEIDKLMELVTTGLSAVINERPDFEAADYDKNLASSIALTLKGLYSSDNSSVVLFCTNKQVKEFVAGKEAFKPVSKPFTPDHIVNCKDEPLFVESADDIRKEFEAYTSKKGYMPKIVAVKGLGFFALSENQKNAERAKALFLDTMKIATYAKSFGGVNPLDEEFTSFILNWEVEAYRSKT